MTVEIWVLFVSLVSKLREENGQKSRVQSQVVGMYDFV